MATSDIQSKEKESQTPSVPSSLPTFLKTKIEKELLLRSGYSLKKRTMEYFWVICYFCVVLTWGLYQSLNLARKQYAQYLHTREPTYVTTFFFYMDLAMQIFGGSILGMLCADFVSGVIHWAADTWGTLDWPIVGKTFIRSFREHHVAPQAMCKHDFVETNGDNCMVVSVCTIIALMTMPDSLFLTLYWCLMSLMGAFTNQIHKWSHMYKVPFVVNLLQSSGIILSRHNHHVHHMSFDSHYCITTGWLNWPLEKIGFWRRLETIVTKMTGLTPRSDDLNWINNSAQDQASLKAQ